MQAREFLSKLGDMNQTQIFAKIENVEVSDWKQKLAVPICYISLLHPRHMVPTFMESSYLVSTI